MNRKTVLIIRSSTVPHCLQMFDRLRRTKYAGQDVRWIWILQPGIEDRFRQAFDGMEVEVWRYPEAVFTYRSLRQLFSNRLSAERVDEAYMPMNHPAGRGYFQIVRFLSSVGIAAVTAHVPPNFFEPVRWPRFLATRLRDAVISAIQPVLLVVIVPCAVGYYFARFVFERYLIKRTN